MADQFTPTPDEQANIDAASAVAQNARSNLSMEQDILQRTREDYNPTGPEGTMGSQPTFNEPTPQDHMQDLMKAAPLFMALGALGGAFSHQSGITMLASTNAMMKGLVQGNAEAYDQAREKYEKDYAQFKDKNQTWMDVYRAYLTAYKGRVDASVRAVAGANAAVGIADKDLVAAHADVAKRALIMNQIDRTQGLLNRYSRQDITDMIKAEADKQRADAATKNADTNATKAATAAAKGGATDADTQQTVALGNEIIAQLESHDTGTFGGAGIGGMLSRGKEYVATKIDSDAAHPASTLATKADLFTEKMTAALKVKGQRMDAGDRIIIRDAIDIIKNKGVSDPIAIDKIREALRVIQKQMGAETKVVDGVTYTKGADGKWMGPPK